MTNERMITEAMEKARLYNVSVVYGEQREISCNLELRAIKAVICTDEDLPSAIQAIESSGWLQLIAE